MEQKTFKFLIATSVFPIILAFIIQPLPSLIDGFVRILTVRDILITDYFAIGGFGATLLNVGLVSLVSILLIKLSKGSFCGSAIASVYLMIGFSFFGKNILNIIPILCGTFLYSFVFKEKYSSIVHIALLATCFAPIFDEINYLINGPAPLKFMGAFLVSMSFGFITKPVSRVLYHAHEGFNLYNIGFTAGIIGIIYVALMKSLGYETITSNIVNDAASTQIAIILVVLFSIFMIAAFILDKKVLTSYRLLLKETGYKENDYVKKFDFATVLLNMSLNGFIALFYVIVIARGSLNGPVTGSLLTVVGFSGLGKHPGNTIPLYIGVFCGSLINTWAINDTGILLIALFGTALAPVAGYFGIGAGIIAGYLNSSVVLNTAAIHGNINLYNSGFSCGIVASVLVPIFKLVSEHKASYLERKNALSEPEDDDLL